jgi:hypothetical protein
MTQAQMREINQLTLQELSLDAAKLWSQIEEASELGEEGKVEELVQELMAIQGNHSHPPISNPLRSSRNRWK